MNHLEEEYVAPRAQGAKNFVNPMLINDGKLQYAKAVIKELE